jgi:hypothetical protein
MRDISGTMLRRQCYMQRLVITTVGGVTMSLGPNSYVPPAPLHSCHIGQPMRC